ncbi:TonB-dependent receptor [candidate division KSB1 bacterium]|nr:TonB-dependent receptor [candidate division KSB1 bacterium]
MHKFAILTLSLVLIFFLGFSAITNADTTGKISGVVKDVESGDPLPGVNVVIEGTMQGAATNIDGDYVILNVPPGTYDLRFMTIGYTTMKIQKVRVSVGLTAKVDANLKSTVLEMDEVSIVASRPVIEVDRTNSAAYMASDEIAELPVTEVHEILQLQAGVTQDAEGDLHFRGGRSGEVAYLVDGIPVTNRFDGGSSIEIENEVIQELQVISGTFNAEYGQAQSGIVNVVSKTPGQKYSGRISSYVGAHLSNQTDRFIGIGDPMNNPEYNLQANVTGRIPFSKKLSFYGFFRYNKNDGWLNGERRYNVDDSWKIQAFEQWYNLNFPERSFGQYLPYDQADEAYNIYTGDDKIIPMNASQKVSGNAKVFYQVSPGIRTFYNLFIDNIKYSEYDNAYRYTPDGIPTVYKNAFNHTLNITHTVTSDLFYLINLSYFGEDRKTYLYDNPADIRYQTMVPSLMGYRFGGTDNAHETVNFENYLGKLDITWQVDKTNLLKLGAVAKQFNLKYHSIETDAIPNSYYLPTTRGTTFEEYYALTRPPEIYVPGPQTLLNNQYKINPVEFAAYAQDKLELGEIIANVGLRLDYFDPDGIVPENPRANYNAVEGRLETAFVRASKKYQLSPRLGLAFPISDRGVIHVSYGHFLQIPQFQYLYLNSEFEISSGFRETIMGNADLKPERTVAYEVGLQQQLSSDFGLELTIYSKDIRNLLGQEIIDTINERTYFRYTNRDYGNVRGITLSVEKKPFGFLAGRLDYTFMVARGNASDPNAIYNQNQSTRPSEVQKQVIPLDWDETHSLNGNLRIGKSGDWTVSFIGRIGTGLPYTAETPQEQQIETQFENNERKPMRTNVDIFAQKYLTIGHIDFVVFARIFNVFDTANQNKVYASTGRADRTFRWPEDEVIARANGVYTLEEVDNRPQWYSEPRNVQIGMAFEF